LRKRNHYNLNGKVKEMDLNWSPTLPTYTILIWQTDC
jgi:hypothetical protein